MLTTADKAKESFFDGVKAYYLTDAGRELLQRVISEEVRALDAYGASKWTKNINAPGNENEFREAYLFPNKPSYLVYRSAIAKCIVFMSGQNSCFFDPALSRSERYGTRASIRKYLAASH